MVTALPCFKCGKELENAFEDSDGNQPAEGTEFSSYGHYGSTFWDPMNQTTLVLNVCDPCLKQGKGHLAIRRRSREAEYETVPYQEVRG